MDDRVGRMAQTTGDLFEGYRRGGRRQGQAWDEMFDVHGKPRPEYREILQALDQMTDAEFRERTDALASSYLAQGITFDFAGEEKPFPLDAVPRVISPQDWHYLESGVAQRALCGVEQLQPGDRRIGEQRDTTHPQRSSPVADLPDASSAERDAGGVDGERGVEVGVGADGVGHGSQRSSLSLVIRS